MVVGRHLRHSHLGGVFAWTLSIEGEDAGEQGLRTRASKVGRRGRSRHEDTQGGVTWTPAIEGEDADEQGMEAQAIKT